MPTISTTHRSMIFVFLAVKPKKWITRTNIVRINIDTSKNLQKRNVKLSERTVRLNQTHLNLFRRELQTTPNHRFKNLPKYQQTNKQKSLQQIPDSITMTTLSN